MRKALYVRFFFVFALCLLVISVLIVGIGLTWLANDQMSRQSSPTVPLFATETREVSISPTPALSSPTTTESSAGDDRFAPLVDMLTLVDAPDLPMRDLHDLGIRYGRISPETSRVVATAPPERRIGDREVFTVADTLSNTHRQVEAELRAIGDYAYWWVQVGFDVDEAALATSVERFDTRTYPTNRTLFGEEWSPGVDGETRLHIFLGEVPGVGGYYSSADEFVRLINPYSNEKEIFYININNRRPGQLGFDEVLAHEYQHMIHWNEDRNEDTWVNEGLSELAAVRNGFPSTRAERQFLLEPDWPLTNWPDQTAKAYGSAYLFMQYVADRFGDEAVRALVAHPFNGAHGLEAVLGVPFEDLFADWAVALLLDDPEGGPYAFPSLDLNGVWQTQTFRRYPADFSETVAQYGIDYLRFVPEAGRTGTLVITFDGDERGRRCPRRIRSVHNRLAQRFVVRAVLVRDGDEEVVPLLLDEANRGQLEVPGMGADVQEVVLVVGGATPVTTQRAGYTLQATFEERAP